MTSDSHLYIYKPISEKSEERETRLITLQPGAWDDPIVISLEHVMLRDKKSCPDFEALSYVWGQKDEVDQIKVEQGGVLPIRKNLSFALRHLRYKTKKTRKLWIDALCINQSDEKEISRHVAWMGYIYQTAPRVVIFIGELSGQSTQAIDLLVKYGNSITLDWKNSDFGIKEGSEKLFFENKKTPKINQQQTNIINCLMSRPWFSRLWVVQEVALMKDPKNSTIQCGNKVVSWDSFRRGYWLMSAYPPERVFRSGSRLALVKPFPEPSYFLCNQSWGIEIVDLFWGVQQFQCSLPLDQFYGVLGLFKARTEAGRKKKLGYDIAVDYRQTPEDLFEKIQREEIKNTGLHLLRFCELQGEQVEKATQTGEAQESGLVQQPTVGRRKPSWVPMPAKLPSTLATTKETPMIRFKSKHNFRNDGTLEVYGHSIGSVTKTINFSDLANNWSIGPDLNLILNELYGLYTLGSIGTQTKGLQTTLMAILDVLHLHHYDESSPGYDNVSRKDMYNIVSEFCDQKRRDPDSIGEIKDKSLRLAAARVNSRFDTTFRKPPMLYVTDKDEIGLGTIATEKGDQVCAIYGVGSFMILRPDGGGLHRVVGPTCVSSQKLAEGILGPMNDDHDHDNTWVVYDSKEKHVLKRNGEVVVDARMSGLSKKRCFELFELDIDSDRSKLAKRLKSAREKFILI